ncbi:MAG: DNA-binding protein [Thermoprotei archaeon]|nr:MAG: DNA-binding protein [Thermoprotei archaeon]RLF02142.1 MAG: DNA-binding protein [Thermoprotei archaeon]
MKIRDLRNGMRGVEVEGTVVEKGNAREVNTRYGPARVSNAVIQDDSGRIILSLWNDDIEKIEIGDRVRIENGYVTSYKGRLQLSVGRRGRLVVLK